MPATLDAKEFQAELRRFDTLSQESARIADPAAQAHGRALVQAVLGLHGAGLERIFAHLEAAGETGRTVLDACVRDEVVGGLLLLHGLHPLELKERSGSAGGRGPCLTCISRSKGWNRSVLRRRRRCCSSCA
jgi:hypothetical protein